MGVKYPCVDLALEKRNIAHGMRFRAVLAMSELRDDEGGDA